MPRQGGHIDEHPLNFQVTKIYELQVQIYSIFL